MQKKLRTLLVITIMTLTACGKQATPDETVTATSSTVQEELLIESENATDFVESVERGEAFDLSDLSPIEALKKVLLSEAPFYCCTNPGANKDILDLDGDDVPEIVLAIGLSGNPVVLLKVI